jgi:hypothetical protein
MKSTQRGSRIVDVVNMEVVFKSPQRTQEIVGSSQDAVTTMDASSLDPH